VEPAGLSPRERRLLLCGAVAVETGATGSVFKVLLPLAEFDTA
jgi:hypothetical protein